MLSATCWYCKTFAQMVHPETADGRWNPMLQNNVLSFPDARFARIENEGHRSILRVYSCAACGYPNIAEAGAIKTTEEEAYSGHTPEYGESVIRWLPLEPSGKTFPDDVSDGVADIASEVHKCLEINANRTAVVLARIALEGIVTEQEDTPSKKDSI